MDFNDNSIVGTLFWTRSCPDMPQYPWLNHDENCEVAIIGNGMAGAMCARRFADAGVDVVLLGEKPVGFCATSAAQGIAGYQLDAGLIGLSKKVGMDAAVRVFDLCAGAVDDLEDLSAALETDIAFQRRDGFFFTACECGAEQMQREYLARRHNGFAVELIDRVKAREMFSFPVAAGILSAGMACECDPYKLTHALVRDAAQKGARVYENTAAQQVDVGPEESVVTTDNGFSIRAKKVIIAAGFETARHLKSMASMKTAFTIVTAPVPDFSGWQEQASLLSDDCPPLRLRTTPDARIMVSGLDCGIPALVRASRLLPADTLRSKKLQELTQILSGMFPGIRDITPEYAYSAEYAQTFDCLPIIGEHEDTGVYYALISGENGIAFSMIAADLLLRLFRGDCSEDLCLFSPER